jgi:hypothetical protein
VTLDEVNERFCLVGVGAQTVVAEEVIRRDGTREYSEYLLRSIPDFKNKLIKEFIRVHNGDGELTTQPLANVWLNHQRGRQHDQLVYRPPGSGLTLDPRDLNGWKGLTVTPQAGSWSRTQDFIWTIVCQHDRALYEWILDWMAAVFQRPGQHADTAIVATGHEGTGKNFFADTVIGRCFDARHARVTTHVRQVLGEFNAILSGLCVLVLDEAGLATDNDARALRGLAPATPSTSTAAGRSGRRGR